MHDNDLVSDGFTCKCGLVYFDVAGRGEAAGGKSIAVLQQASTPSALVSNGPGDAKAAALGDHVKPKVLLCISKEAREACHHVER